MADESGLEAEVLAIGMAPTAKTGFPDSVVYEMASVCGGPQGQGELG
jgi:hypothetical protein